MAERVAAAAVGESIESTAPLAAIGGPVGGCQLFDSGPVNVEPDTTPSFFYCVSDNPATPLVFEGEVLGALAVFTGQVHRFNNDEKRLCAALASLAIFDSDDVLSQLRAVQAIVTHLETFPKERACAACLRAEHFGGYSYRTVRNILRQGLDLEPLPEALPPPPASPAPRFARPQHHWRH